MELTINVKMKVEGAETMVATTPGEVIKVLSKGSSRRTTASTQMNAESSRSHLICSLVVKLTNKRSGAQSIGKLTLVDLAGSEVRCFDPCNCRCLNISGFIREWINRVLRESNLKKLRVSTNHCPPWGM